MTEQDKHVCKYGGHGVTYYWKDDARYPGDSDNREKVYDEVCGNDGHLCDRCREDRADARAALDRKAAGAWAQIIADKLTLVAEARSGKPTRHVRDFPGWIVPAEPTRHACEPGSTERLEALERGADASHLRVEKLHKRVDFQDSELAADRQLSERVGDLEAAFADRSTDGDKATAQLTDRYTDLRSRADAFAGRLDHHLLRIEALAAERDALEKRVSAAEAKASAMLREMTEMATLGAKSAEAHNELERRMALTDRYDDRISATMALGDRLEALEKRLTLAEEAHSRHIDAVWARVDGDAHRLAAAIRQLRGEPAKVTGPCTCDKCMGVPDMPEPEEHQQGGPEAEGGATTESKEMSKHELRELVRNAGDNIAAMRALGMTMLPGTQFKRLCNALGVEMPIDRRVRENKEHQQGGPDPGAGEPTGGIKA
jgi:hypothetical protein